MRILIKDATVITLADPPVLESASVAIADGRIQTVGSQALPEAGFDRVIDGSGKLVTPGFINAHTHLAMVLLRGYADDLALKPWLAEKIWPAERRLTEEDVYWGALLGIAEMLRSGTTAFADMYFFMDAVAQAVEESGLRALLAYGIIAPEPGEQLDHELQVTEKLLERWHGAANGRIRVAVGPHAPYTVWEEGWRRATALALQYHTVMHTHLQETRDEVQDFSKRYGCSPTAWLEGLGVFQAPTLVAHGVHLGPDDITRLARYDVRVAHCPTSNLKLASGIAPVPQLLRAGLVVGLGTDGAASNNNLDLLEELRLAALLHKREDPEALPAPQALELATVGGARALGFPDVGQVVPGQRADLVIWNCEAPHWIPGFNPVSDLVYAAQAADVETVLIDGRPVLERGEILTFDESEAQNRVRELSRKWR